MAKNNECWGIEVGSNALKAIKLVREGNEVVVEDYDILPFKRILTTPDLDVDEAVQVNLDAFMSRHDLGRSQVVASVPGHLAFARFAKLPPVEPKKVPDIVRFEAVQQIPFPIDQVEWDYQVFQQADSPDVEVGIFAITKERVLRVLNNYNAVNLRVDALTLSPVAVYNAFAYENAGESDSGPGTIYMDVGTVSTDVIIVEGGGIWLRTLPIGGNNFTEALVKQFKISFPKAEKLKREMASSKYRKNMFQAMRPVFSDLVQEIQRSLGYYQSLNRESDVSRLVGIGSTFRLPGLTKFLQQQLQLEVSRPDGYKRIAVEGKREAEFANHALNLATAYGLALQGLGKERVTANILPAHIQQARMWKAKQPWIAAAAACIVAGAAVAGGVFYSTQSAYRATAEQAQPQIQSVLHKAQHLVRRWDHQKSAPDPRIRIDNLRTVTPYRGLWAKLHDDIAQAAASLNPQPATTKADYDQMSKIPRGDRRRIYIESINATYVPQPQPPAGANSGNGPPGSHARAGGIGQMHKAAQFFGQGRAPRFQITVTGTTPYKGGAAFLQNNFVHWLTQHADQPDRPYRFLVDPNNAIPTFRRVSGGDNNNYNGRGGPPGGAPGAPGAPGASSRFSGGGGRFDQGPRPNGGSSGSSGHLSLEDIFPARPLGSAAQAGDNRFVIQWIVELKSPSQLRQQAAGGGGHRRSARASAPDSGSAPGSSSAAAPALPQGPSAQASIPTSPAKPEEARS